MKRSLLLILAFILAACGASADLSTPRPQEWIDTGVDTDAWSLIPAGEFPRGQNDQVVDLDYDFQMMVTNVTVQHYAQYLNDALNDRSIRVTDAVVIENENTSPYFGVVGYYPGDPYDGYEHEDRIVAGDKLYLPLEGLGERIIYQEGIFSYPPEVANHPITMVSWFGAQAFCEYYGWRLPLELEWEKGARGTDLIDGRGLAFPWGNEIAGNYANYYSSADLFEKIAGKSGGTTPTGFYNGSVYQGYKTEDQASPYGLYDMAGNVWQWTGDDYPKQHYRYLRGGSYYSYEVDLRVWKNNSAGPTYFAPDVGFRCARDQ